MQFFDFNIPYLEGSPADKTTPSERAARKKTRLKLVVKAAELGYSGVAYNRSIKGVMSESDRCSISLFPLSSLLSLSPALSSSASFHRLLLSGPRAAQSPFRQYTRLTVSVENPSQSSALNSGNPILKTYDLVAVRPMNQVAFDQACQFSEVDLISIDFSDKMPFRLKLPMVKAAISRGVYFEIAYSGLIEDVQVRRQVISNTKLLVDWTRGKNLIAASAAPSVLDFRGPNDVANLLSLLGLATEHAKASISKNCRSLIANTLRKKQCYKEAIRVEKMPMIQYDPKKPWIIDPLEWDPISSGEGDLLLEDLAKSFSEASKGSETLKPNSLASTVNNSESHGLKVKHLRTGTKDTPNPSDDVNFNIATVRKPVTSSETEKLRFNSQRKPMSLFSIPPDHHSDICDGSLKTSLLESEKVFNDSVNTGTSSIASLSEVKYSNGPDIDLAPVFVEKDQSCVSSQKLNILNADNVQKGNDVEMCIDCDNSEISARPKDLNIVSETTVLTMIGDLNPNSDLQAVLGSRPLNEVCLKDQSDQSLLSSDGLIEEALEVKGCEETHKKVSLLAADKMLDLNNVDEGKDSDHFPDRDSEGWSEVPVEEKERKEVECCNQDTAIQTSTDADRMQHVDPSGRMSCDDGLLVQNSRFHGEAMDLQVQGETHDKGNNPSTSATKSVKLKLQQRGQIRFPFKHLLQLPFKRKAAAHRHKMRKR